MAFPQMHRDAVASPVIPPPRRTTRNGLDTGFLRLLQVETNHLCQHREETWVIIGQRGTSEGKVLRCGKSAGLTIQSECVAVVPHVLPASPAKGLKKN